MKGKDDQEYYGWNKPRKFKFNIVALSVTIIAIVLMIIGIWAVVEFLIDIFN